MPADVALGKRFWGISVQLYSLRSVRKWGMGDFGDLVTVIEKMSKLGCVRIDVTSRTQSFNKSPGNTQRMERFGLPRQLDAMLQELRCHFQSELRASIDARRTLLAPVAVGTCGQTTTEEMPYARDSKQNMRIYSISSGIE